MKIKDVQNASKEYVSRIKGKFKSGFILFSVLSVKSIPVVLGKNYLSSHPRELITLMRGNVMICKHKILTHDMRLSSVKKYFQLDNN